MSTQLPPVPEPLSLDLEFSFASSFDSFSRHVHQNAVSKGFYETPPSPLERLALIHAEVSEATEAYRHGNPPDDHIPEYSGAEAELADAVIRIMDMAAYAELDVAGAIIAKIKYNSKRPYKHGKQIWALSSGTPLSRQSKKQKIHKQRPLGTRMN